MTWEEALTYSDLVDEVAAEWAHRIGDRSLKEDIAQEIYIGLVEGVDSSRAKGSVRTYVRSACWKIARDYLTYGNQVNFERDMVSLQSILKKYQVDDDGDLVEF